MVSYMRTISQEHIQRSANPVFDSTRAAATRCGPVRDTNSLVSLTRAAPHPEPLGSCKWCTLGHTTKRTRGHPAPATSHERGRSPAFARPTRSHAPAALRGVQRRAARARVGRGFGTGAPRCPRAQLPACNLRSASPSSGSPEGRRAGRRFAFFSYARDAWLSLWGGWDAARC